MNSKKKSEIKKSSHISYFSSSLFRLTSHPSSTFTFPFSLLTAIIFISFYILLLNSCTTEPRTGSLTGTVNLEGEYDHSGITVGIYELVTLDTTITRINNEYPHIGIKISQHTEFDHRFANLTKYTHTDANGNFKINDIPTGRYNFMAMKDGFGFKYIYEISITEGDNFIKRQKVSGFAKLRHDRKGKRKNDETPFNLSPLTFNLNKSEADIILYPETIIKEDITENTVFESFHHYIVTPEYSNYLEISGDLTIEPGAVIRIEKDKKLTISGDLTAIGDEDNFIWFTSNDPSEICSQAHISRGRLMTNPTFAPDSINYYNRVELIGNSDKEMAWCKFDHAGTGLLNNVNGFSISNCIFRNSCGGFESNNLDSTFCWNLLCNNISFQNSAGVNFTSINSGVIEKSIFCNSYNGLRVKDQVGVQIKNNMFTKNTNGVYLMSFTGNIINNEFENNEYDISICGATSPDISYNITNSDTGIFVLTDVVYQNATPIIQRNNFYCKDWFIFLAYRNRFDIETNGNYFNGLTDIAEIKQKIMDKEDYAPNDQEFVGNVLINSVSSYTISGAGIHR